MAFYPLTERRFRQIVREMAERRAARAVAAAAPAAALDEAGATA
jgi:Na+/melibiose symporter-like transporter